MEELKIVLFASLTGRLHVRVLPRPYDVHQPHEISLKG
jgi:hypothetical protein